MKFAAYVAWILLCESCKFDAKIFYSDWDNEFFLGDCFLLAHPVYTLLWLWIFRLLIDNLRPCFLWQNTQTDVQVYYTRLTIQEFIANHPAESTSCTLDD